MKTRKTLEQRKVLGVEEVLSMDGCWEARLERDGWALARACIEQTQGGGRAENWGGGEDGVTVSDLQ